MFTAIINSPDPIEKSLPRYTVAVNHVARFESSIDMYEARIAALNKVTTPYAFFLDSDDALPTDINITLDVVKDLFSNYYKLVYTEEAVVNMVDGTNTIKKSLPFSHKNILYNPFMIHHLAVFDVELAKKIVAHFPRGNYWFELMLFYCMAANYASAYLPRIGYIYNQYPTGMHTKSGEAVGNSLAWATSNYRRFRSFIS